MKIFLQTADDLLFLAGDGRLSERVFAPVSDWELTGELVKQIVRKVRASHARVINRGKIRHQAFFRTRRLFPTPAEAEQFVANAERSFPREGTLYFVTGEGTRKLRDTVIKPPITRTDGCLAYLQYQAAGGELTPLEPELVFDGASGVVFRVVEEVDARWFEIGFESPVLLDGDAETGWLTEEGYLRLRPQRSENLTEWDYNVTTIAPEATGDNWIHWARFGKPIWYYNVISDLSLSCDRYGKSITEIRVGNVPISLPSYPYAMPSQAATLQTHLRSAGYTGAVVSNVTNAISVEINNHIQGAKLPYQVTLSGSNVTQVRDNYATPISLPSYPYAMPAARATLQADLRTAGHTGAVVKLYGDEWTIFLPDVPSTNPQDRAFQITFTPTDPFKVWDFFGTYLGELPDSTADGTHDNIRPGVGQPELFETARQFGRIEITPGPNYLY